MPNSTVHNMDCLEFLRGCSDKQFDLVVADPQYGIGAGTMAFTRAIGKPVRQKNGTMVQISGRKPYEQKEWDTETPGQEYFDELQRVSHDQIIFGIDYMQWEGVGTGRIKWDKCVPDGMSFSKYEMAYCSLIETTTEIKLLWSGMQQAKSLAEPTTPQGNKKLNEKRIHPTQKPILLYKWLYAHYAHGDANILDTHLGSGSSRIAAYDMGFDFTGIELDPQYFKDANKRFELFKSQGKLF